MHSSVDTDSCDTPISLSDIKPWAAPQATLNKTAQWWVPVPEGNKQRMDYWAVVGKMPSNATSYEYTPEDPMAEGWWNVEVGGWAQAGGNHPVRTP